MNLMLEFLERIVEYFDVSMEACIRNDGGDLNRIILHIKSLIAIFGLN